MAVEIDKFHHILETTVNALSILFNCYLLYLIKHYSAFGVKMYQYLLTIDALLDLFLAVVVFFGQPVALTGEGYFVMKSNGFFAGRSPVLDFLLITIFAFILHTNVLWIPVQFVYRYRLLCKENEICMILQKTDLDKSAPEPLVGLTGDGYIVMLSNGFFAGLSPVVDSLLITLFAFILHTNVLWIPVQFVYRYRLLCRNNQNSKQVNILIVTFTTLYSLIAWFVISAMCQVREEFQAKGEYVLDLNDWPKHEDRRITYYVGANFNERRMIIWLFLWTITCSASVFIVVWCEKKIVETFSQFGKPTQATTQKMHKDFHRALLAMAICPLITTCVPVLYFFVTIIFSLCLGKISAIMAQGTSSITLFNPLTTIMFLRCYRRAAVRLITCGLRSNVVDSQKTTTITVIQ